MIPTIPKRDTSNLKESLYPSQWEHLGGPFAWLDWSDDTIYTEGELADIYGPYVYAEWYGRIGELVHSFTETGYFPEKSYLFSGPQGIGKTALIKLMALTNLADQHHPVRLNKDVIVLNPETDTPYLVNPVETDDINFDTIQYAINHPGDNSNGVIESHNAGMMYKDDVNKVAKSVSRNLTLYSGRRVIIINEFDNVGKRQVSALKNALDPGGGIPDGLVILTDTNYPEKVKKTMGGPGMARFQHFHFGTWSTQSLFERSRYRLKQFDVAFDEQSFEHLFFQYGKQYGIAQNEVPAYHLAVLADGAIRDLHTYVASIARFDRKVTFQALNEITAQDVSENGSTDSSNTSQLLDVYLDRVIDGTTSTASFTKQAADRKQSLSNFVTQLVQVLYVDEFDYRHFENPDVHDALQRLLSITQTNSGPPMKELKWASATRPLDVIANALYAVNQ